MSTGLFPTFLLVLVYGLGAFASSNGSETSSVFRYHVPNEPASLDPARLTSTDASYFFNNIQRGLFSYSATGQLKPEGAKECQFETPLKLKCRLRPEMKWSDGSVVVAADYVRTFRRLIQAARNPSVELLWKIKNASAINSGSMPASALGVRAETPDKLLFEFHEEDPEFLYKLTHSMLVPSKTDSYPKRGDLTGLVFNGPYRVTSWTLGHRLRLEPNAHYPFGSLPRPTVEILFIDDDQTALHLYEEKTLSFLRRLPTTYIRKFRDRPDFHQIPVSRFDYLGFGPALKDQPLIREALSYAADYAQLKVIYEAPGIPGCTGLPEEWMSPPVCVRFDPKRAKKAWSQVPEKIRSNRLKLYFSKLGGDDVKKGMEWFQSQWKTTLGARVDLEQTEQGVFLALLRKNPPAIFRKGVGLERPTCLAALETFTKDGSENFLRLDDPDFARIIARLTKVSWPQNEADANQRRAACSDGVRYLLDRHLLIPLGKIHFTILARPSFTGWSLNSMNQLDLSQLKFNSK